ncbi:MAG: hypothetical protein H6Q15_884 [Bacteroidetes bacterium]|nr:hypothetical protein [Bacteroidota bacterium]
MRKGLVFSLLVILVICSKVNYAQNNNDKFQENIKEAKDLLSSDTNRGDLLVLIASNYAWQSKFDSALVYIQKARDINYYNDELFDAWLNILLWSKDYNGLLNSCDIAQSYNYKNNENLIIKRLIAYDELRQYDNGINLVRDPKNKDYYNSRTVSDIYTNLLFKRNKNIISAFYSIDMFDNNSPQHLGFLGYGFNIGKHTLALRANYANRFSQKDLQLEADFYLQLRNKAYMYFNYAYSFDASLFPENRLGYEFYMPWKYKIEYSLGLRYLSYSNSQVLITTGHIEKYMGQNWFSIRPYYAFMKDKNSLTLVGNYRFYSKNGLNFFGVELGYGNSPDDRYTSQNIELNQLHSYKVKLEGNLMLSRISDLRLGLGYSNEEYKKNEFRNRYLVELGIRVRLR